ncbi:MAG: hypothetical protein FWD61_18815 [Phycisphaerales bacterium]|nr:hypothetical protein [Phycisphaerales bacterium]
MAENWTAILTVANKSLLTKVPGQTEGGGISRYAQDRAMRIVQSVEKLARSGGNGEGVQRVDLVKVAALYAGVAQNMAGEGERGRGAGTARTPDDSLFDDAAELAADQLKDLLPPADLELVGKILREHRQRETQLPEAKLLADAMALEEFGLVGLWNLWRQFHAAGKTLEQFIKLWKAQHDYSYWESRLRDGFHFETSRRTAKERLGYMRGIYERLQQEQLGEDVGGNPMGRF